jgi:hypothetical protein
MPSTEEENKPGPTDPKHSGWQILKVVLVLGIYSIPAIDRLFLDTLSRDIGVILVILPAFWIIGGIYIYSETIDSLQKEREFGWDTFFGFPQSGKWAPDTDSVEYSVSIPSSHYESDLATLRLEYESLISEAQYRDKLLLRTTYFALGAVGLFAGAISATGVSMKMIPAIAMLASIVMLSFAIATNSYKDSRDALWGRIGRLETEVPAFENRLTTFSTVRGMDLRLLNTFSLSSYAVGLTIFMTILAYLVYICAIIIQI